MREREEEGLGDGRSLGEGEARRHGQRIVLVHHGIFGIAAAGNQRAHPVARLVALRALAQRHHLARDLAASAPTDVANATTSANATVDMIAATYFAGWHNATDTTYNFTLEDVSWSKYTHVIYAFA